MSATAQDIKQTVHQLADQLPDNATWDDVMEEVRFYRAVEKGIRAAERGDYASDEEVRAAFAKWGVDVTRQMD